MNFLGTPHRGSKEANLGAIVADIASLAIDTNKEMLTNLEEHSGWLQEQQNEFRVISGDFGIVCFVEDYKTPIGMINKLVSSGQVRSYLC